jgi:hypothetical protein
MSNQDIIKRWIGYTSKIAEEDNTIHKFIAMINQTRNDIFEVHLYEKFSDSLSNDIMSAGCWTNSISSAKRLLCQDTDWKSKDFVWEIENIQ